MEALKTLCSKGFSMAQINDDDILMTKTILFNFYYMKFG